MRAYFLSIEAKMEEDEELEKMMNDDLDKMENQEDPNKPTKTPSPSPKPKLQKTPQ